MNQILLEHLRGCTQGHCAYCDGTGMAETSRETIDHFLPKSAYPEEAFAWRNLYYCCDMCQSKKRESEDPLVLRPDDGDYVFHRFFVVNARTGRLEANPACELSDQERANATIALFGLNEGQRPDARKRLILRFQELGQDPSPGELDNLPYRYCLE